MKRHKELRPTPGYRMPRSPIARRGKQQPKRKAKAARFYASATWKRIRLETFRLADFTCAICGHRDETATGSGLVCDHVHYQRFGGQEIPGHDTRCLCQPCDRKETPRTRANHFHGLNNRRTA